MKSTLKFLFSVLFFVTLVSCATNRDFAKFVMKETDMELMTYSVPIAVKGAEIMHFAEPNNRNFALYASMLYVMYANVFVQTPAEIMDNSQYEVQYLEKKRAKMHYLRGRDYALDYFKIKNKHFVDYIQSDNPELQEKALKTIKKKDVAAAYWLGAGWLGAFSLDPVDSEILKSIRAPVLILERACMLDPEFNNGSIWDVLCAFYAAAPEDFGGDKDRAVECFLKEIEITKGQGTSIFMTYAQAFCMGNVPLDNYEWTCKYSFEQMNWDVPPIVYDEFLDSIGEGRLKDTKWPLPIKLDGFDWALNNVLNQNVALSENSMMTMLAQKKAKYLKEHREDFFVIW
ncbi:MAG: TRAP transporter TatT component family protein [Treponemataceae bacterium]